MDTAQYLLLGLPVLLLSFTVHEFMHAYVALRQGDDTAYMLGRVTLNPASHIDPIGSILFPAMGALTGAPLLGWARPVPTTPRNYRNFRRGDILVSLAGIAGNAILVVLFLTLIAVFVWVARVAPAGAQESLDILQRMFQIGVVTNVGLIFFNLIPIPPLDGSRVLYHYLPPRAGAAFRQLDQYGWLMLWMLVIMGGFRFLGPVIWGTAGFLLGLVGLLV
ncbi:MAG TPA: site-2 protease family protein [Longimicrobium sp.]|nr:site-2 protease family protein [Longimicrobium sp.]